MQALYRRALAEAGDTIRAAEDQLDAEVERIAVQVHGAISSGIGVSEIAELTGLSRQKIYDLRKRQQVIEEDLDMQILAQLGAAGALTAGQVCGQLGLDKDLVIKVIGELEARGLVRPLMSRYEGGQVETHFKITKDGAIAVERWMLGPEQEPTRVSVYAAIDMNEKEAIRDVAIDLFGPEWFAIIEPETIHGQDTPELAFHVVADSGDDAVIKARERMDELRQMAGVRPRPPVITALAPAGPLHLTFGRDRDWITGELEKESP